MIQVQPAPGRIVDDQGLVRFGVYDRPLHCVNLEDARLRWHGLALPRLLVRLRLKAWQHYALILPDVFVGVAVVDAGFLRTSWCFVVERGPNRSFEHRRSGPFKDVGIARELYAGHTYFRSPGYRIEIENRLSSGEHLLALEVAASEGRPAVRADLRCAHDLDAIDPMEVVLPVGPNQAMYSHKVPLPLSGTVTVGDHTFAADGRSAFAILDVHRAHYPRHTFWRWATFAGRDAAGRSVGVNLTRNVIADDDRWNENGIWLDGRLEHVGPAAFEFDPGSILTPWKLRTRCGAVDLTFTPRGERQEDLRLGLARSVFHQPYGTFSGTLRFRGTEVPVDRMFGVCEDHDALW
jgi:hypothetical protein